MEIRFTLKTAPRLTSPFVSSATLDLRRWTSRQRNIRPKHRIAINLQQAQSSRVVWFLDNRRGWQPWLISLRCHPGRNLDHCLHVHLECQRFPPLPGATSLDNISTCTTTPQHRHHHHYHREQCILKRSPVNQHRYRHQLVAGLCLVLAALHNAPSRFLMFSLSVSLQSLSQGLALLLSLSLFMSEIFLRFHSGHVRAGFLAHCLPLVHALHLDCWQLLRSWTLYLTLTLLLPRRTSQAKPLPAWHSS
ncbi:hypothetical protein B0T13DRAFT_320129 [Neurospora crassa]|nr:hypothetical protein B0T13DRAFT_320129 [Neurospora crassa]